MTKLLPIVLLILTTVAVFSAGCQSNEIESATVNALEGAAGGEASTTPVGRQRTTSGLQYEMLFPGTGMRPNRYSTVTVHYIGKLTNGSVFDSSVQRGQPATFSLQQVIAGWQEGIPLMQEGSKFRFTIPPHLGYGSVGAPPKIGPNETLIFEVELIRVHN